MKTGISKTGLLTVVVTMVLAATFGAAAQTPPAAAPPGKAAPAASPPPPQPYRTEILNYDNWNVTCRDFTEGKRKRLCFATLQIVQQNTNQAVFTWTMAYDDDNRPIMTLQTPTGVALAPGVELKLAKGSRSIPYTSCEQGHCVASIVMNAALAQDIATSPTIEAMIRSTRGDAVTFTIPMKGYDKAFAGLQK